MSPDLKSSRPLAALYPELERLGAEFHAEHHDEQQRFTKLVIDSLENLVDLGEFPGKALVVGCGPKPRAITELSERGFEVVGIEPVRANVVSAEQFCGGVARVVRGSCEVIPEKSDSQRLVLLESVLEHVESVPRALAEVFRVLEPGGILYVYTTNRHKISLTGFNGEYSVRFLNWFPRLVRECYVHDQLHFRPELANYNARPAVHWFTYSELCRLGRDAGFARFYSLLDLVPADSSWMRASRLRRLFTGKARRSPWWRALALTQSGGAIFMVKRAD